MQSKLCLVLALAVLVGALAGGNPFLSRGVDVPLRAVPGDEAAAPLPPVLAVTADFRGDAAGPVPASAERRPLPMATFPGFAAAPCPDASLRALVVRVRPDAAGRPIWVLNDGRQVRANPRPGPGQPAVVLVDAGAFQPGDAEDEHAADGR